MGLNYTLLSDKNLAFIIVSLDVALDILRVFAAIVTLYFLYKFGSSSLFHKNLKILLIFLPISFTLVSVAQLANQFSDLFSNSYRVWLFEQIVGALYALFFLCCALSPVFIYLERILAVQKRHSYEEWSNTVGIWFVTSNVVGSTFCTLMTVLGNCMLENQRSLQNTLGWDLIFWSTFVVTSALTLMLHRYISNCNLRYENNEQSSLAERFQSHENKTSLVLLRPIIFFFLICSLAACATTAISMKNNHQQRLCQNINNCLLTAMHLFFMMYILRKHEKLWKIVRRDICIKTKKRRAIYTTTFQEPNFRVQQETIGHFRTLEKLWNK